MPPAPVQHRDFDFVLQMQEQYYNIRMDFRDFLRIALHGKRQGMSLEAVGIARVLKFVGQHMEFIPILGKALGKIVIILLPVVKHIVGDQQDFFHACAFPLFGQPMAAGVVGCAVFLPSKAPVKNFS